MQAYIFCALTTAESRANTWYQKNAILAPQRYRLLSVLRRWFCCCWFVDDCYDSVIVLYFVTLCPFLFCDHLDGEESWLLCLVCLPGVSWLLCGYSSQCHGFVCSLWLWYSLTILGCHSCEQRWLWRVCTFAWSSLSHRHSSKFSWGDSNGDWMPFCASSKGSGESAHLHRLTLAFATVQNLMCCLKWRVVCYSRQQRVLCWVCTFAQA